MQLSYQAFLAEAFNSEPYPYELEDKSTSMDRFFIITTETGDRYRLWFEVQKKMGGKVMRAVIGQATPNAKVFKKIVQKFNNPLRLFSTMMEIFREGIKNDQYMRVQDGFAIAIPKEAFGNVANAATNIAARAMRGTMFESASGVAFKDAEFEYISFVRKGKDVTAVFNGSNAQVAPKAGSVSTPLAKQTADVLATGVAAPKVIGKSSKPLRDLVFAATDIDGSQQRGHTDTDKYASREVRVKDPVAAKKHAEAVLLANGFKFKQKNAVSGEDEYVSSKMTADIYFDLSSRSLFVTAKSVATPQANPIIATNKAAAPAKPAQTDGEKQAMSAMVAFLIKFPSISWGLKDDDDYQKRGGNYPRSGTPTDVKYGPAKLSKVYGGVEYYPQWVKFSFKNTSEATALAWAKREMTGKKYTVMFASQEGDYHDDWVEVTVEEYDMRQTQVEVKKMSKDIVAAFGGSSPAVSAFFDKITAMSMGS